MYRFSIKHFISWNTGSHLKLWPKNVEIQHNCERFQKFLCTIDGHDRTDFWIQKFFCFRPFFDLFSNIMDRKNARAKKVINIKNQFLHARQPCEGIFYICSHRCCIFTLSCQSFKWLPVFQF